MPLMVSYLDFCKELQIEPDRDDTGFVVIPDQVDDLFDGHPSRTCSVGDMEGRQLDTYDVYEKDIKRLVSKGLAKRVEAR